MPRVVLWFKHFLHRLWWRTSRPEDIPQKLSPAALENAMREARFLRGQAVNVQPLAPGEIPGLPRRADGSED